MKEYKRHPLSAQYPDITGTGWDDFVANLKEHGLSNRCIMLHEGKVLDGWQLYRACVETGTTPPFAELPTGIDPQWYVETANDHRRHDSPESVAFRAKSRRARANEARSHGDSIRTIAEREKVAKTTIERDLKKTDVPGGTVVPPNGKVTGKDGKKYKASTKSTKRARSKPGRQRYDWSKFHRLFSPIAQAADRIADAYADERKSEEFKECNLHLNNFISVLHRWQKRLTKASS